MIEVKYKGKVHNLRNSLSEFTIEEFEYITARFMSNDTPIDIWSDIFLSLDYDYDLVQDMDIDTFTNLIASFDMNNEPSTNIEKVIEIDGIEYKSYTGDKFRLKIKDLTKIEMMMSKGFYYADLLAFIYKRDDYTSVENNSRKHLDYKSDYFKTQKTDLLIPILNYLNVIFSKKVNI